MCQWLKLCPWLFFFWESAKIKKLIFSLYFFMMFDQKNFSQEVLKYDGLVLVDFFAPWCGPCQAESPIIEELAEQYKDKAKIGKLNVEEVIEVAQQYNVMSIPALIFFKNGKEIKRLDGFHGRDELIQEIDNLLK